MKTSLLISAAAFSAVGLDDMGRYTDIERTSQGRGWLCTGEHDSLIDLVTEIYDRATESDDGFNELPATKRALLAQLRALAKCGWLPRS